MAVVTALVEWMAAVAPLQGLLVVVELYRLELLALPLAAVPVVLELRGVVGRDLAARVERNLQRMAVLVVELVVMQGQVLVSLH